jgi:hypothetical protein
MDLFRLSALVHRISLRILGSGCDRLGFPRKNEPIQRLRGLKGRMIKTSFPTE